MLLLKLFLVPSLIGGITMLGRRFGAAVAGLAAGLPVVAGPILLLVALDQGKAYAAASATGALAATIANICFCLAYAWAATRYPWWACIAAGIASFAAAATLLTVTHVPPYLLFALTLVLVAWIPGVFPRDIDPAPKVPPPKIELPARMLAAALLVLGVTRFTSVLGSQVSGILSSPPLLATVLAGFSHPVSGAGFAIRLLQNMVSGIVTVAVFCFALALLLPRAGVAPSFAAAVGMSLAVGAAMVWARQRPRH